MRFFSIKLFIQILFFAIALFSLVEYRLVIYGISQGKGQLNVVINAQPIQDILKDETFPDSLKYKLTLIQEIKQFAIDSIGIKKSENYTTVFNQHDQPILFTISACEPYSFKAKEWTFPFLGTVSYKGFFEIEKAKKEIRKLKLQGYDIDLYSPSAWSTLGWFQDPILSNMLYRTEGQLANLIIHELSHGTLFVKNNITFNENLANFIGDKGAEKFLLSKFGNQSKQYIDYENSKTDEEIFKKYILKSTDRLDSLYSKLSATENDPIKKQKKNKLITEIVRGVLNLPLHKKQSYFRYALQAFKEKNTFFMGFTRYDSQYATFENEYSQQFHSSLKEYMVFLKKKYPSL
jgi:predicted aminopeptidase